MNVVTKLYFQAYAALAGAVILGVLLLIAFGTLFGCATIFSDSHTCEALRE